MPHPSPGMPFLAIIPELLENRGLGRIILIENEQPVVDAPPRTPLKFPVVGAFEKRIKPRHDLLECLLNRIALSGNDKGMRFGNRLAEENNALMHPTRSRASSSRRDRSWRVRCVKGSVRRYLSRRAFLADSVGSAAILA